VSPQSAEVAIERLVAMVPWIASQGAVSVDELCARFGIEPKQLVADLTMVSFVGAAPHTDDVLLYVDIDDGIVSVRPQWFDRPLRLTTVQGLMLVTAVEAALEVPGADPDGPLGRALPKLAAAVGLAPGEGVDVDLGSAEADVLAVLEAAVAGGTQVRITYWGHDADRTTERVIEPWVVALDDGRWCTVGWCHRAEDRRWFRIDRITEAEALAAPAVMPVGDLTTAYVPPTDVPQVTLRVTPERSWVVERWPVVDRRIADDGSVEVVVPVIGAAWLERVLLQLGPDVTIVDDGGAPGADRAAAARRVLVRYRSGDR
jgi:proteasome accessory factor C